MKKWRLIILFAICFFPASVFAVDSKDLTSAIEAKLKDLNVVKEQIQKTQKEIETAQTQQKSLKQELSIINGTVNQVNLGIKASQINIEKLNLELESLQGKIFKVETDIGAKRDAIVKLLRELQTADSASFLLAVLKNKSLAESFSEIQNTEKINQELSGEVGELKLLQANLTDSFTEQSDKRGRVVSENVNLKNRKGILDEQKIRRNELLTQTQNQEKIYKQQLSALEKKQAEISDAIDEIETELRKTFDPTILPIKRPGVLAWPVERRVITQQWGEVSRLYRGKPHNGTDFGVPYGTAVYAADDGEVAIGNNGRYQYGKYIVVKHANNLATLYAHLSKQVVEQGAIVKKGELIGYGGSTGYSTGPHLHFGLYWAPSLRFQSVTGCGCGLVPIGISINPLDYL